MRRLMICWAVGALLAGLSGAASVKVGLDREADFASSASVLAADDGRQAEAERAKIVPSGFLGDYSDLVPDEDKKHLLVYRKGDRSITQYHAFIVDRPLVYFHPEAQGIGVDPRDLEMLVEFLHQQLTEALSKKDGYEIVDEPGEGVAHLRVAITDVVPIDPAKNTGPKAVGMALGVGLLVPRLDLGSASVEVEIRDSTSGERLVAAMATKKARRFGGVIKGSKEWGDAKAAFKNWAQLLRKRLDKVPAG